MLKKIFQIAFSAGFLLLASPAQAQVVGNVTGDLGTTCSAAGGGAAIMPALGACTFTPTVYKVSIFEMGALISGAKTSTSLTYFNHKLISLT